MAVNSNNSNLSLEDERKLAKEYSLDSSINPISTTPVSTTYMPGMSTTRDIPLPDYESREKASKTEMPNIVNNIRHLSRGSYSAEMASTNPFNELLDKRPQSELNPYGQRVALTESHEMTETGEWVSKYPKYHPGINNEDYYARRQGTWNKVWNGIGKLGLKTALYGVSGVVMVPDKLMAIAREGSLKAALNTKFDSFADDLDKSIDRLFPHYYRKEVEDYNLGQKIVNDTGNFIWNDVVGSGMSFTLGAMLTAAATGGLGATSIASTGAKIGLRAGAKLAARDVARRSVGGLKGVFNNYLRSGVSAGSKIGGIAQNISFLSTSAAFEAGFESRSYAKESEQQFKDYYNRMYGRDPNFEELSAFRETNNVVAGGVFAANMGIVGLSNWLLFGKYFGVGGKTIGKGEKWLNKKLFGLGTEVKAPGEIALKVTDASFAQKVAGTVFNITKRPFSEGIWEEGSQGVVQNAAEEYVESRYNKNVARQNVGVFDAIWDGFKKQYTTKEGWNEIGIGAIIGGIFGAREGLFGTMEYRNRRIELDNQVKDYNSKVSNLNGAAVNLLKQSISLGPQISQEAQNMTSKQFDESTFAKMSVEHDMGILDDSSENFRTMMKSVPLEEIAQEHNISIDEAQSYVNDLIEDYDRSLSNFKNSVKFAENLVGEDNKPQFKDYIARNAFMGLQASNYLSYLSKKIGSIASKDSDISYALDAYSRLSKEARVQANELYNLKGTINNIEKELEDLATRPTRVNEDGVDTAAEDIKNRTAELEKLREEYDNTLEQLSTMTSQEFNIQDFLDATVGVEATSIGLSPTSAESIVAATEQLKAFDNFLTKDNKNAKNIALRNLIEEYKDRLIDYRNLNNTLSRMLDKRFMRQEERGFMKLLSDVFTKDYKETETPDMVESGSYGLYQSDKAVDQALAEKSISEDEAYSIKALIHSMDQVRREDEENANNSERIVQENVSDEAYDRSMEGDLDDGVRDNIIDKLYTENEHLLTPREREIYNNRKDYFDNIVSYMGDSPTAALVKLRSKVQSLLNPTSVHGKNQAIIDLAKDKLNRDQQREFDDAINKYNELSNKRDDGQDIDETELLQAMYTITDLGEVGNISDLIPFIEQNRVIERGVLGITTLSDFGSTEDQLASLANEVNDYADGSANIDSAQNPSVLMARLVSDKVGGQLYEVSGLKPERFAEEVEGFASKIEKTIMSNGLSKYEIVFHADGVDHTAVIVERPAHNRFVMSEESADIINQYSDFIIKDVSGANGYFAVLKKNRDGNLIPFKSDIGFGVDETDRIDEDALSKVKTGDDVELVIDTEDTYNQSLYNKYLQASNDGDKNAADKAKIDFVNNMVIKILKDGKLVSVVKADFGDGTPGLSSIRTKAFSSFIKNENSSSISLGTVKVAQTLPGKPNYTLSLNDDGSVNVDSNSITKEGAKKIVNVGFIFNGKVNLKEKGKYSVFPFGTNIIREAGKKYKDVKVPVVVIEGLNGMNYVYPVSLKSTETEEDNYYTNIINELTGPDGQELIPYSLSEVQEVNSYLTSLGLSPSEYQIALTGSMQEIQDALKKAKEVIEHEYSKPNVDKWISDDSRSVSDVAMNDVNININLENDIFIAPKIRLALPGVNESNVVVEEEVEDTEELPFSDTNVEPKEDAGQNSAPAESEGVDSKQEEAQVEQQASSSTGSTVGGKRGTSKKFDARIKELPKEYKGFFDFIGRQIASGDLKFLRVRTKDKRSVDDIRRFLGLSPTTDEISKISSSKGMPIGKYIDWLRSSKEDVVKDYLSTRTDDQIMMELKTFLNAIKYKPSNALNYSRRVNGMDVLKEYTSEEDVNKMEAAINNEITSSLELSKDVDEVVDDSAEAILNIPKLDSFEEVKEYINESNSLTDEEIVSVVDQVIEEYSESLPEGEQNVFDEQFIEKWEKIKDERESTEVTEEGSKEQPVENSIAESAPAGEGQPGEAVSDTADGGLSGYEGVIKEEQVGITDELSIDNVPRVTAIQFLFAGEEAYTDIPGTVTEIPANILKRNGIKKGISFADLNKLGYKRAGGSWVYKFYMNTGLYDMYNIHTGEAFRLSPNEGVKVNSSSFLLGLNQKGRNISNLIGSLSNEEIQRRNSLINETDLSQSNKEINKPC